MSDRVQHALRLLRELSALADQTTKHEETAARLRREFVDGQKWSDDEREQIERAIRRATNT